MLAITGLQDIRSRTRCSCGQSRTKTIETRLWSQRECGTSAPAPTPAPPPLPPPAPAPDPHSDPDPLLLLLIFILLLLLPSPSPPLPSPSLPPTLLLHHHHNLLSPHRSAFSFFSTSTISSPSRSLLAPVRLPPLLFLVSLLLLPLPMPLPLPLPLPLPPPAASPALLPPSPRPHSLLASVSLLQLVILRQV
eukprot:525885-Hanusia_phi.AAC.1